MIAPMVSDAEFRTAVWECVTSSLAFSYLAAPKECFLQWQRDQQIAKTDLFRFLSQQGPFLLVNKQTQVDRLVEIDA